MENHLLKKWVCATFHSKFGRSVVTLAITTSIAQLVPIIISPILTRLYSPEDFGVFALYMSIAGILSVGMAGRYELAIVLPKENKEGDLLAILSLALLTISSVFLLLVLIIFAKLFVHSFDLSGDFEWLLLVPLGSFLIGAYNVLYYWLNRYQRYKIMGTFRIVRSGTISGGKLVFNVIGGCSAGLIIGRIIGESIAIILFIGPMIREIREQFSTIDFDRVKEIAIKYKSVPLHVLPAQWMGVWATQMPVFILSAFWSKSTVGFYTLAYQIVTLPAILIANAIGDVFRQRAAFLYQTEGNFRRLYIKTLAAVVAIAFIPFLILFVWAPTVFRYVFGEEWLVAGRIARLLAISGFFQFVFTPTDKGALVVGATLYIFIWHLVRLIGYFVIWVGAYFFKYSFDVAIVLFVFLNSFLYFWDGVMEFLYSGGYHEK